MLTFICNKITLYVFETKYQYGISIWGVRLIKKYMAGWFLRYKIKRYTLKTMSQKKKKRLPARSHTSWGHSRSPTVTKGSSRGRASSGTRENGIYLSTPTHCLSLEEWDGKAMSEIWGQGFKVRHLRGGSSRRIYRLSTSFAADTRSVLDCSSWKGHEDKI